MFLDECLDAYEYGPRGEQTSYALPHTRKQKSPRKRLPKH